MDRRQATALVAEVFTQRFDETRFRHFLRNLVNHLDESDRQQFSGSYVKHAFAEQVGHYVRLGTYTDPRGDRIDCLAIYLRKETTLARGRVTLRNFVADYLSTGHGRGKAAVVAAFVSPTEEDWRFSFIKLDFTLETTELGFVTERAQLTPARRYSYLVGQNENCHTAQKQFLELLETDHADPTVSSLEAAFSVEKVTKEFFEQYHTLFEKTRDSLTQFIKTESAIVQEFEKRGITVDDFSKKLLGQIVFLYFLQKKGWFGVERGSPWGSGRKDFIRHIFRHRADYSGAQRTLNFFNDILEPLFYEALASPRLDDDHYYSRFDCRIPFLNGGLFEPLYGYNWVETDVLLPDALFSNDEVSDEGDSGTGILDVFDRYNFTVNEAEPLEKEVAVDPEMLGKVFENLLPENIRHSSGTYYTPRVVVHYMCQQALLNYLAGRATEISHDELDFFLRFAERFTDFEVIQTANHSDKRLPSTISNNAEKLDNLLANITVCDPAIGSGAFPVGMMHEIVRARMALTPVLRRLSPESELSRSAYALKRHAIQHCLYGVDDDPGAVEIAKLRLWLSMVVDEDEIKEIQPLPNLDFKVMQGNSLIEEYDGVRLLDDDLLRQDDWGGSTSRLLQIDDELKSVQQKLSELQATDQLTHNAILELKNRASALNKERNSILARERSESRQVQLGLGSRGSLKRIQQLHTEFFDEASRVKKEALRAEMESLEWEFMRATLREQGREEALAELERASAKHRKPYFLWKLHFAEIFNSQQGFDVVIANPPFVRMENIKELKPALKRRFPHFFAGRADLYVYFYGLALDIVREGGCVAFISSNSYLNSKFGGKLRECLAKLTGVKVLIDFAETKVFDAVVEPAIIILQKGTAAMDRVSALKWREEDSLEDLSENVVRNSMLLAQSSFSGEPWQLSGGDTALMLAAIRRNRKTLADYPEWKPLGGLVTGLNKAFILSAQDRERILRKCPKAREIIHPFLRGRDIAKWRAKFSETYVIFAYHGIDISRYPGIEEHLRQFAPELEARASQQKWYELRQPQKAFEPFFRGPKLLYQEINRSDAFSYDNAEPLGMFVNNKIFFIPNAPKALLAYMNSTVASFFLHTMSGVPPGGFLALQLNIINPLPIPNWTERQQILLGTLADYLLWVHGPGSDALGAGTLLPSYLERWVNALVYELFFPEQLHVAGLYFFRLAEEAKLRPISEMKGGESDQLRNLFETAYRSDHPVRRALFVLDSLNEVRIIEGKA